MLGYFEEMDLEEEFKRLLKERFLEVLVRDKMIEEERFHTQLAYSYIDIIFKRFPRSCNIVELNLNVDQSIVDYYNKLKNYLRHPTSKYSFTQVIVGTIPARYLRSRSRILGWYQNWYTSTAERNDMMKLSPS